MVRIAHTVPGDARSGVAESYSLVGSRASREPAWAPLTRWYIGLQAALRLLGDRLNKRREDWGDAAAQAVGSR